MSFFGVTIEEVEKVWSHPNADKLDLASLKGMLFQFVVGKGNWNPGDSCLYFPVDSIVPIELQKKLGVEGRLSGKAKNRIKTIKLRGEISQGMIGPITLLDGFNGEKTPENITKYFGIVKYEPEPVFFGSGKLLPLPSGMSVYDIEGADRYEDVLNRMMDLRVNITEKLEGTNFSIMYKRFEDKIYVNTHRRTIVLDEGKTHTAWECAKDQGLIDLIKTFDGNEIIIYGELCGPGIQKNIYKLKDHRVFLFDIKVDGRYYDPDKFKNITNGFDVVPEIADGITLRDWLNGNSIQDASNGKSLLGNTKREGIVVRPMIGEFDEILRSRLILKQRSPEYLAKSGN